MAETTGAVLDRPHRHEHAYDSATSPDHRGRIEVTERCSCGHALCTYPDSVL